MTFSILIISFLVWSPLYFYFSCSIFLFLDIYRKHRGDIVSQFYQTLKMILKENPECNKLCELVYYDGKNSMSKWEVVYLFFLFQTNFQTENIAQILVKFFCKEWLKYHNKLIKFEVFTHCIVPLFFFILCDCYRLFICAIC